jgi:hypothetical protein
MSDIQVTTSGPVFDGRADTMVDTMLDEVLDEVGDYGQFEWQMKLEDSLRHPTGRYQARLNVTRAHLSRTVNDRQSVYGPWLEGTGSRNTPATRFAGYWSARRATAALKQKAKAIGQPAVDRGIERINGE